MQLASMNTPRSVRISATCRYASGYRRYQRTASRITSPGYCRPLNGCVGVIGMDVPTLPERCLNFATEPPGTVSSASSSSRQCATDVVPYGEQQVQQGLTTHTRDCRPHVDATVFRSLSESI